MSVSASSIDFLGLVSLFQVQDTSAVEFTDPREIESLHETQDQSAEGMEHENHHGTPLL
jgi:hypothetical protein